MKYSCIGSDHPLYPQVLADYLGNQAPDQFEAIGNAKIIQNKKLAIFSSIKCPGDLIIQTYDLAQALRETDITVIGGFHSPMEKECLTILLKGKTPVIVCSAKSVENLRIPKDWKKPIEAGKLLILSPFSAKHKRATAATAQIRNEFVAAIADAVFITYAAPGGKTEQFAQTIIKWGKPLYTLDGDRNSKLIELGAKPIKPEDAKRLWD